MMRMLIMRYYVSIRKVNSIRGSRHILKIFKVESRV